MAGDGLLCCCPVSVVRGGAWIFRLSNTNSSVVAATQTVQWGECGRELTGFMIVVCFEPEAVGNATLSEWWRARGATCHERNLWRWREVSVLVCIMGHGDGP